jgi:hypothetical protein
MGRTGFPQKDMDEALARLRRTYERMDSEIAKSGGPWLLGASGVCWSRGGMSMPKSAIRVDALFEEAVKFCATVGLHKTLMHEIYDAENDWTCPLRHSSRFIA